MKKQIRILQMIISVLLLCIGCGYALFVGNGYAKGRSGYAQIKEEYTHLEEEVRRDRKNARADADQTDQEETMQRTEQIIDKQIWSPVSEKLPQDAPTLLKVDWDALLKRNSDIACWIDIPAVNISYPVVQAADNDYYLHRDVDRNYLYAGSIFLDANCSDTFYGYNSIVYGHNMRDGSMFARLEDFKDPETLKGCRYFWILTPEANMLYKIYSCYDTSPLSDAYRIRFATYQEYEQWLEELNRHLISGIKEGLHPGDRIVTLSTCTDSSQMRTILQGKLVWRSSRE